MPRALIFMDFVLNIYYLVLNYTREAGVRNLERKIGALCRAVAVRVVEKSNHVKTIKEAGSTDTTIQDSDNPQADIASTFASLPPDLPIVLDEAAVEDILGVLKLFNLII